MTEVLVQKQVRSLCKLLPSFLRSNCQSIITCHDISPLLSLLGGLLGHEMLQVSRLDLRQDPTLPNVLQVVGHKVDHGASELSELLLGRHRDGRDGI